VVARLDIRYADRRMGGIGDGAGNARHGATPAVRACGAWGTGAIPKDAIKEIKRASGGTPDLIETALIRYGGGGDIQAQTSRLTLKTYDQGRLRWQGETLDFVWFDEEPPEDIYTEGLTRTNATNGIVWITFTPLLGASEVVRRFLENKYPGTHVTTMTIDDAEHYTAEQRKMIVASYPVHQRKARAQGIPVLGSGAVFPVDEELDQGQPVPDPRALGANWRDGFWVGSPDRRRQARVGQRRRRYLCDGRLQAVRGNADRARRGAEAVGRWTSVRMAA
jgi:phage terminase large subunit-like protein